MVFVDIYERGDFFLGKVITENEDKTVLILQDGKERTIGEDLIFFKHYTENEDDLYDLQSSKFPEMDPKALDPSFANKTIRAKRYDDYATILRIDRTIKKQKEIMDKNEITEIPNEYNVNLGVSYVYNIFNDDLCDRLIEHTNNEFESIMSSNHRLREKDAESRFIGEGGYWRNRCELMFKKHDTLVNEALSIIRKKLKLDEQYTYISSSCFVNDPGSSRQILHIDFGEENTFYVYIALQGVTMENGPTLFIPGTSNGDTYNMYKEEDKIGETLHRPVCVATVRKGDGYVFDTHILHSGLENISTSRRIIFGSKFLYEPRNIVELPFRCV